MDMFFKLNVQTALDFAVQAHHNQFRKGLPLPYIVHPIQVLCMVADWGIEDEDIWRAALCHDILEDCPHIQAQHMANLIGDKATSIVEELTFKPDPSIEKPESVQKQDYMQSFGQKSDGAVIIKYADRCCNTLDFMRTDRRYALKYWHKGEPVIKEALSRKTYPYPLDVYERMNDTEKDIQRRFSM